MQLPLRLVSLSIHRLLLQLLLVALVQQPGRRQALLILMHGWSSCKRSLQLPRAEARCRRCEAAKASASGAARLLCYRLLLLAKPLASLPLAYLFVVSTAFTATNISCCPLPGSTTDILRSYRVATATARGPPPTDDLMSWAAAPLLSALLLRLCPNFEV